MTSSVLPYRTRLREHLAIYKRNVLGVTDNGLWNYRGRDIPYAHILPAGRERLNIIEGVRDEFWAHWDDQVRRTTPPPRLHRYFAHLTSSQALAFNLFFPLLTRSGAAESLLEAFGEQREAVAEWRFEAILDSHEGTNFDVGVETSFGRRLLVEVKLSESDFGTCQDDARHRWKLSEIYAPKPRGKVRDDSSRLGLGPHPVFHFHPVMCSVFNRC